MSGDTSSETAVHNEESKVVATHKMGRPSNGSTSGNGAGPSNGHSSNGVGLLEHVTLAGITQRNMYPDDDDWAEQQGDVVMADGEMTVPATTQHGKRMPVDREEFVKLVLQGLRDVGYEYVLAQVKLIVDKRHLCWKPSRVSRSLRSLSSTFKLQYSAGGGPSRCHFCSSSISSLRTRKSRRHRHRPCVAVKARPHRMLSGF